MLQIQQTNKVSQEKTTKDLNDYYISCLNLSKDANHWLSAMLAATLGCAYLCGPKTAAMVFIFGLIPA